MRADPCESGDLSVTTQICWNPSLVFNLKWRSDLLNECIVARYCHHYLMQFRRQLLLNSVATVHFDIEFCFYSNVASSLCLLVTRVAV